MAIRTYGPNAVDWEQRDRPRPAARRERLARLKDQLERSELGALLTFDFANIRYMTVDPHRHLGDGQADPVRAAAPRRRAGRLGLRLRRHATTSSTTRGSDGTERATGRRSPPCAAPSTPTPASPRRSPARSPTVLREHGLAGAAVGVDIVEMPVLAALRAEGLDVVDGQQVFLEARRIKTADEIALLTQACSMVDAAYERAVRVPAPGRAGERVRRAGQQGPLRPRQRVRRGRQRHLRRALLAAPARLQRPDHPPRRPGVLRHPAQPPRLPHLLLPHASRSAAPRRRSATPTCAAASTWTGPSPWSGPGATTADIVSVWPRAEEFGFPDEEAAFALQYGHGVGLSIWEKPIFSRLVSLDHPEVLEEGMVFALETYWPAGRRLVGRPHRGGGRGHRRRLRGHHQVPGRGAAGRRPAVLDRRRPAAHAARVPVAPQHSGRARGVGGMTDGLRPRSTRRAARPVRADGGDPAHREGRPRPVHGRPGQGHHAPGGRARGGRRRRERRPARPTTTSSPPTAATTTPWPAAPPPRSASPS